MAADDKTKTEFLRTIIGKPYARGADGPDAFDCYGCFRAVQERLYGAALPTITRDLPDNYTASLAVRDGLSNRRVRELWAEIDRMEDGDAVVMNGVNLGYHIGTFVTVNRQSFVVHADPRSGVIWDDLPSLATKGLNVVRSYRRKTPEDRSRDPGSGRTDPDLPAG